MHNRLLITLEVGHSLLCALALLYKFVCFMNPGKYVQCTFIIKPGVLKPTQSVYITSVGSHLHVENEIENYIRNRRTTNTKDI